MLDLTINELKKIYRSKILYGLLVLLVFADIYKINEMNEKENIQVEGHEKIYVIVKGRLTEEKIQFVIDNYEKKSKKIITGNYSTQYNKNNYTGYDYGDYSEFEFFYHELKYVCEYKQEMDMLCKRIEENNKISGEKKKNIKKQKINSIYKNRTLNTYYDMSNIKKYLEYDFSTLLIIIALFFIIPEIIFYERKNGMELFWRTLEMDCKKIMAAKIAAVAVLVLLVTVVFGALDFIAFYFIYGMEGLGQPLYSIEEYKYTIFSGTVMEYIFIEYIASYFAFLFFAYFCLLCSFFIKDQTMAIMMTILCFIGFVLICMNTKFFINPVALLENHELVKEYRAIRIGEYDVFESVLFAAFTIVSDLVLVFKLIGNAEKQNHPIRKFL